MRKIAMRNNSQQHAEQGMVSILVTLIMILVIALIIIGLSQITRSNRRQQLDQQLSAQAYYAAESGLNQAAKFFAANPLATLDTMSSGNCTSFITSGAPWGMGANNVLDSTTKTSYTCLMVNSTPGNLQVQDLTQDSNKIWRVRDAAGQNFTELRLKWGPSKTTPFTGASNTCLATNALSNLVKHTDWNCAFGILRIDLVDTHGTVSSTTLSNPAKTIYLVPTFQSSGTPSTSTVAVSAINANGTGTGQIAYVLCTATLCDVRLTPAVASNEYFARLSMIYQDAGSVQLSGTDASGAAKFSGGQVVVDVTGKAQDQLRRVQARIPLLLTDAPVPNFALQSVDTLCKSFGTGAGITNSADCW